MERTSDAHLPHGAITSAIIGIFFDVFRELGHGFGEIIYTRALAIALEEAGRKILTGPALPVAFRGRVIGRFHPDIVVDDTVIVEVKATAAIEPYAEAQILNYLKAAGGGVGLLLNFGREPAFRRRVMGNPRNSLPLMRSEQSRSP